MRGDARPDRRARARARAGCRDAGGAIGGLALTSANLRGEPPPDRLARVPAELRDLCAFAVDGGVLVGTPSSVIDVTGPEPVLLRAGADAAAAMTALLG